MPIIVFLSFALCLGLYINTPLADPDLWWHIVSGRWIISNSQVPTQDHWTLFASGKPWIAYSWSNQIIYALTDKFFGLSGLFNLQAFLAFSFAGSVCYVSGKLAKNFIFGCLIGTVALIGCVEHFALRPQTFVWILFAFLILSCFQIKDCGLNKKNISALLVIFCLWANTHITSIIGITTCFLLLLPFPFKDSSKQIQLTFVCCLICLLATFITPYSGQEWLTFFSKSDHPLQYSSIQEFTPANILFTSSYILILMLTLCFALWLIKKDSLNLFEFVLAATLVFISLLVYKFTPFSLVYLACLLSRQWSFQLPASNPGLIEAIKKLESAIRWLPNAGLAFMLLCIAYFNYNKSRQNIIDSERLPVSIANFIIDNKLQGPVLNTFGDGGYLSYRFSDLDGTSSMKVSIDGRTNLIEPKLWKEYELARTGMWGWKKMLERVKPEIIVWVSDSPLVRLLETEGKWCSVMKSGKGPASSVLMLKKESISALQPSNQNLGCLY